jgi:HPt (histidine-containing phosphotransfer) domain-containing protein
MSLSDFDKEARLLGQLARVRERFLLRAQGELPLLRELLEGIQAGDLKRLVQLRIFVHRIHGTGATFDFAAISASARQIENFLEVLIGTPAASVIEPHDLRCLIEYGRRLELEIGAATNRPSHSDPALKKN